MTEGMSGGDDARSGSPAPIRTHQPETMRV